MPITSYAVALGSNRRGRHGSPEREVAAALALLPGVTAFSPTIRTPPLGPARRRFANAAALVDSANSPSVMLDLLKDVEARLGRRPGRRWGDRVIDLDLVLWSGGAWDSAGLLVPHRSFRERRFVLDPLVRIVPDWRDPVTGLSVRQLHARLTAARPLRRAAGGVGP